MANRVTIYLLTIFLSISTISCQTTHAEDLYNETAAKILKKVSDLQTTLSSISNNPDFSIEKLSDQHQRLLMDAQNTLGLSYRDTVPLHIRGQDQSQQFEILRLNRSSHPNNIDPMPEPSQNLMRLLDLSNEIKGNLSQESSHLSDNGVIIGFKDAQQTSEVTSQNPNEAFMETAKVVTDLLDIKKILESTGHGPSLLPPNEDPLSNEVNH
jgi:hypothetical protein